MQQRDTEERTGQNSGRQLRGMTLVEVILVLALLVVIGAVSVPMLEGSFSRAALRSAGDLLRGAWSKARLAAMESGETHVFRFEPNGRRYEIATLNDLGQPDGVQTDPEDPDTERSAADILRLSENRLPDGVTFVAGHIATSSRVMATLDTGSGEEWSDPIVFYPDGTTSDASLVLSDSQRQTVRVTLRGLTGISNMGEVGNEERTP